MDFIVKLLFLSGKYLTQAAGRTIFGIISRGVTIGKNIGFKYERATQIVRPDGNMLQLLNSHIEDVGNEAERITTSENLIRSNNFAFITLDETKRAHGDGSKEFLVRSYKKLNFESPQKILPIVREIVNKKGQTSRNFLDEINFDGEQFAVGEVLLRRNSGKFKTSSAQPYLSRKDGDASMLPFICMQDYTSCFVQNNSCFELNNSYYNGLNDPARISKNRFDDGQSYLRRRRCRNRPIKKSLTKHIHHEQLEKKLPSQVKLGLHPQINGFSLPSKSEANLNRMWKQTVASKRKLSSSITSEHDVNMREQLEREWQFVRMNQRAFHRTERRLLIKQERETKGQLDKEDMAQRKKLIEVNQKAFDDLENDLSKIVIINRKRDTMLNDRTQKCEFIKSFKQSLSAAAFSDAIKENILRVLNKKRKTKRLDDFKREPRTNLLQNSKENVNQTVNDVLRKLLQETQQKRRNKPENNCANSLENKRQCCHVESKKILELRCCDGNVMKNSNSTSVDGVMICVNVTKSNLEDKIRLLKSGRAKNDETFALLGEGKTFSGEDNLQKDEEEVAKCVIKEIDDLKAKLSALDLKTSLRVETLTFQALRRERAYEDVHVKDSTSTVSAPKQNGGNNEEVRNENARISFKNNSHARDFETDEAKAFGDDAFRKPTLVRQGLERWNKCNNNLHLKKKSVNLISSLKKQNNTFDDNSCVKGIQTFTEEGKKANLKIDSVKSTDLVGGDQQNTSHLEKVSTLAHQLLQQSQYTDLNIKYKSAKLPSVSKQKNNAPDNNSNAEDNQISAGCKNFEHKPKMSEFKIALTNPVEENPQKFPQLEKCCCKLSTVKKAEKPVGMQKDLQIKNKSVNLICNLEQANEARDDHKNFEAEQSLAQQGEKESEIKIVNTNSIEGCPSVHLEKYALKESIFQKTAQPLEMQNQHTDLHVENISENPISRQEQKNYARDNHKHVEGVQSLVERGSVKQGEFNTIHQQEPKSFHVEKLSYEKHTLMKTEQPLENQDTDLYVKSKSVNLIPTLEQKNDVHDSQKNVAEHGNSKQDDEDTQKFLGFRKLSSIKTNLSHHSTNRLVTNKNVIVSKLDDKNHTTHTNAKDMQTPADCIKEKSDQLISFKQNVNESDQDVGTDSKEISDGDNRGKPHLLMQKFAFRPMVEASHWNQPKTDDVNKNVDNNILDLPAKETCSELKHDVFEERETYPKTKDTPGDYKKSASTCEASGATSKEVHVLRNKLRPNSGRNDKSKENEEVSSKNKKLLTLNGEESKTQRADKNNSEVTQKNFSSETVLANQKFDDVNQLERKCDFSICEIGNLIKCALAKRFGNILPQSGELKVDERQKILAEKIDDIIKECCHTYEDKILNTQKSMGSVERDKYCKTTWANALLKTEDKCRAIKKSRDEMKSSNFGDVLYDIGSYRKDEALNSIETDERGGNCKATLVNEMKVSKVNEEKHNLQMNEKCSKFKCSSMKSEPPTGGVEDAETKSGVAKKYYILSELSSSKRTPDVVSTKPSEAQSTLGKVTSSLIIRQNTESAEEKLEADSVATDRKGKNKFGFLEPYVRFERNEDVLNKRLHKVGTTQDEFNPRTFVRNKTYTFGPITVRNTASELVTCDQSNASHEYKKVNTITDKLHLDSANDSEMLAPIAATGNVETQSESKFTPESSPGKKLNCETRAPPSPSDETHDLIKTRRKKGTVPIESHELAAKANDRTESESSPGKKSKCETLAPPSSSDETYDLIKMRRKKSTAQIIGELYRRSLRYALKRNDRLWLAEQQLKEIQRKKKITSAENATTNIAENGQQCSQQETHVANNQSIYERFPFLNKYSSRSNKVNVLNKEVIDNISKRVQNENLLGKYKDLTRRKQFKTCANPNLKQQDTKVCLDPDNIYERFSLLRKTKRINRLKPRVIKQDRITERLLSLSRKYSNVATRENRNRKEICKRTYAEHVINKNKVKKHGEGEFQQKNECVSSNYNIHNAKCSGLKLCCYSSQLSALNRKTIK